MTSRVQKAVRRGWRQSCPDRWRQGPRGWPSESSKLLAIVAALVGLALLIAAFLGGFLLPVAKDCPAAFADQAAVTGACL